MRIQKIISGGQTGVDRAALDFAIQNKIPHGGFCPKGRLAEDGPIPDQYQLIELESEDYRDRTEKNVIESDGTLIIYSEKLRGGTKLTATFAKDHSKPVFKIKLDQKNRVPEVINWIRENQIQILNVAGPRESSHNGIAKNARKRLEMIWQELKKSSLFD